MELLTGCAEVLEKVGTGAFVSIVQGETLDLSLSRALLDVTDANEEAVELRRQLAETESANRKDLADSLHSLGMDLSRLGRHEDALQTDEEAAGICRKLAETDPTTRKDLAWSLHSLGFDLRQLGRNEDALHADEEARASNRPVFLRNDGP